MTGFFYTMIYVSVIIELLFCVVFCGGILLKSKAMADAEVFKACNKQMKACRVSSVVFAALYWFVSLGLPTRDCLEGFSNLSTVCLIVGCMWVIAGFVNIIMSIVLAFAKRGTEELTIMKGLRRSNFFMGAVFFVITFLLKVN